MASEESRSEETVVVATYSSRQDAEAAKGLLSDRGITSFVAADDVHPPLQITEGSRVRVLGRDLAAARDALHSAGMLPGSEETDAGAVTDTPDKRPYLSGMARWTTWAYIAIAVLIVAAVLIGSML